MRNALWFLVLVASLVGGVHPRPAASGPAPTGPRAGASPAWGGLPMSFEVNGGQVDPAVRFLARGQGYTLLLTPREAVFELRRKERPGESPAFRRGPAPAPRVKFATVRMRFAGARGRPEMEGDGELAGKVSYFCGNDPARWLPGLATFAAVRYREVYAGIDLVFYGNQHLLEFDYVLAPGADPGAIGIAVEGAERVEVDAQGGLVLHLDGGAVHWHKPVIYQTLETGRREVAGGYVLRPGREVGFQVGAYDRSRPLVIDPVMVYGTYLGGSALDAAGDSLVSGGQALAVDRSGNVYVTGETDSLNFPTNSPYRGTISGSNDVFVTKLNSNGTALVFSTYLGGSASDGGTAIAVDRNNLVYVVGRTTSGNFPTRNAYQSSLSSGTDAFLAKLGPMGTNLTYASYLGGSSYDVANCVAVDAVGTAYVAGETDSGASWPQKNPWQNAGDYLDAFVARFNTTNSGAASLVWSSWLGSADDERATAIMLDAATNLCVVGEVLSADGLTATFPVLNAWQPVYGGGFVDGFITKLNPATRAVLFSTYLGGEYEDSPLGVTLDAAGNYWIAGTTSSTNFPVTTNAVQTELGGLDITFFNYDAFVTKFSSNGSNLLYSTFLGGELDDAALGVAVDALGHVYLAGETGSDLFPVTTGADQELFGGGVYDAFALKFNSAVRGAPALIYSTYLGGGRTDSARGLALDGNLNFYVAGLTSSSNDFPTTTGSVQARFGGGFEDAFVAKFASPADLSVSALVSPESLVVNSNLTFTLDLNNNSRATFTGVALTNRLPAGTTFVSVSSTVGNCAQVNGVVGCAFGVMTSNASARVTLVVTPTLSGPLTNDFALTANEPEVNWGNNFLTHVIQVRGLTDVTLSQTAEPNPVFLSSNLSYTLTVANRGQVTATGIVLTNTLSPGVALVSYNPGSGFCYLAGSNVICFLDPLSPGTNVSVRLLATATAAGPLTNRAAVSIFDVDLVPANNVSTLVTTSAPLADLSVLAAAGPSPVRAGSNYTYSILVSNRGPSQASGTVLTNLLPTNVTVLSAVATPGSCSIARGLVTCNLGALASNATAAVVLTARPDSGGSLTNLLWVTSPVADPVLANNVTQVVTTAYDVGNLGLSMTATPASVTYNSATVHSLVVTNHGPGNPGFVVLTDNVPAGMYFLRADTTHGSCTHAAGVVTCQLGTIWRTVPAVIHLVLSPAFPGVFTNTACVTHPLAQNPVNVCASAVTTGLDGPTLTAARTNQALLLSFPTTTGSTYHLEYKPGFMAPSWTLLQSVPGTGGPASVLDTNLGLAERYYRLRVQ